MMEIRTFNQSYSILRLFYVRGKATVASQDCIKLTNNFSQTCMVGIEALETGHSWPKNEGNIAEISDVFGKKVLTIKMIVKRFGTQRLHGPNL